MKRLCIIASLAVISTIPHLKSINILTLIQFCMCIYLAINIYDSMSKLSMADNSKLIKFILTLGAFVTIYGVYQKIANGFDLPFSSESFNLRGRGVGFDKQISSVFEEPAFFGIFLLLLLFVTARSHISNGRKITLYMLIFFNIIASKSIIAIGGATIFLLLMFIRLTRAIFRGEKRSYIVWLCLLVLCLYSIYMINYLHTTSLFSYIAYRLDYEVFSQLYLIFQLDRSAIDGSGALRTLGEIMDFLLVFNSSPLFGYGVNYEYILPHRISALNFLVEFFVRFGAIGLIILGLMLKWMPVRSSLSVFLVLSFLFISDGAISKVSNWLFYGLILMFVGKKPEEAKRI